HGTIIQNILNGTIEAAPVDSNILALSLKKDPTLKHRIKIIESWGPYPLHPFVIRKGFDTTLKQKIIQTLKEMSLDKQYQHILEKYLVVGFKEINEKDLEESKKLIESCENLTF
ncbi:MAG: PhnD/SsuA/transferrin family substrate-binding protein, partial [bacterium]